MNDQDLRKIRREYTKGQLLESEVPNDPMYLFKDWFSEWKELGRPDATAMTLATASAEGVPDARIVLLKGSDNGLFTFFTNYNSKKGQDLKANPMATLLFYWPEVERQVRITGRVEQLPYEESSAYFKERPIGSQIGALSSPQSQIIANREVLEAEVNAKTEKYGVEGPECPDFWGGFGVVPEQMEFWQGRASRLHDRIQYVRDGSSWIYHRLAP